MKKYTWYNKELNEALNNLGFVHWVVKKPLTNFEDGKAFFFNEENLTYGYVGFLTQEAIKDAYKNRNYIINKAKSLQAVNEQ